MARFGDRVPARDLMKSIYGGSFRNAVAEVLEKASALGHDMPPGEKWRYDGRELGRYAAHCRTCGMSAILDYNRKNRDERLGGMVLETRCPGRNWLDD